MTELHTPTTEMKDPKEKTPMLCTEGTKYMGERVFLHKDIFGTHPAEVFSQPPKENQPAPND